MSCSRVITGARKHMLAYRAGAGSAALWCDVPPSRTKRRVMQQRHQLRDVLLDLLDLLPAAQCGQTAFGAEP
jgi:hypothetical protein